MSDNERRELATLAELLVESSVDGLFAVDRAYRYTIWNRAMEEFAGKRADEVLGKSAFDVFPFLRDLGLDRAMDRALAGEKVTAEAVPHVQPDASRLYYDRLYLPLRRGGEVVGVLGIVRDATARQNARDALHASEQTLRMAVDAAGIGLWSWDTRTDRVVWEAPLCAIFGLASEAAPVGRAGFLALVHPDDRERAGAMIARGVASGAWEDEYRIVRTDGAVRWVMAKGTVLHHEGRNLVVGAVIDVTERRERDEKLRQTQKLEAVGQLTAGIAHNFNNMLMGLLPNLELIARRVPADLQPLVRTAEESAQRAADLVRQLMTYAGRNRPNTRTVESLGALAHRTVVFCRTTFDKRILFEERYDPAARARVDAAQIEQAILNILINARDALADADLAAPRVTLDVDVVRTGAPELGGHAGDHVRVRIADNGAGMDPALILRIYDPFFTTKDVGKGTGLGLATTQAIVREHGGFIACESAPGKGAAFSLYLACEAGPEKEPTEVSEPPSARGTETVLVVDDEAPIRQVVSLMLRAAGFTARVAASGQEALDLLTDPRTASEVALVLLDVSMPGMSRLELRRRLRDLAPRARVVYFTGYAFEAADADDAVLEKPLTEERLLATIRHVLDQPRRH